MKVPAAVAELRTPRAVRERCHEILDRAKRGATSHFTVDEAAIPRASELVVKVIKDSYPSLVVPVHGRYRHFEAGGVKRMRKLGGEADPRERAKTKIDLVVTSVLLDAGAGSSWSYEEGGRRYERSEGLAVASFCAFTSGVFSKSGAPRADAAGLVALDENEFRKHFQVSDRNPLVGVAGRVGLMHALGKAITARPDVFGVEGRVGGLLDALRPSNGEVHATDLLGLLLDALESIWPGRIVLHGHNLGDTWRYKDTLVPFHKLSQWLSYSLVEPIAEAGIDIVGLAELTGLPEYRNGGLLIDTGALVPKDPQALDRTHRVGDELVVEWRALTVALLDEVASQVRAKLGKSEGEFPLARVLEGGTWAAGRLIAAEKRPGGVPPLTIDSDGTVF